MNIKKGIVNLTETNMAEDLRAAPGASCLVSAIKL